MARPARRTWQPWYARPGAFALGLACSVAVALVLIEGARQDPRQRLSQQRAQMAAPVAARAAAPFPRTLSDANGTTVVVPQPPQRIVSHTLGTDELLLSLCEPQRLVALSTLADDATYSNVTEAARQISGRTNAGAEQTLRFQPDMVFVASYSRAELLTLLVAAGAPVFRFGHFDHLEDIKLNIRTLGYILGVDARAEALVQHMEQAMAQTRASIPPGARPARVMLYSADGSTAGTDTTFDDMVHAVGAINVAAEQGIRGFRRISNEQLLQWNPEVIISSADRAALDDTRRQLLRDPAVAITPAGQRQRILVLPNNVLLSVTPHVVQGIELLARALYFPAS